MWVALTGFYVYAVHIRNHAFSIHLYVKLFLVCTVLVCLLDRLEWNAVLNLSRVFHLYDDDCPFPFKNHPCYCSTLIYCTWPWSPVDPGNVILSCTACNRPRPTRSPDGFKPVNVYRRKISRWTQLPLNHDLRLCGVRYIFIQKFLLLVKICKILDFPFLTKQMTARYIVDQKDIFALVSHAVLFLRLQ